MEAIKESKLESQNVIIRPSTFKDCEAFTKWEKTYELKEFLTINNDRNYEEIVREFIMYGQDPTKLQFTICSKEEVPIGRIYISRISEESDSLDITRIYIGDPEDRGKGYGEEALRLVLDYCFVNLHMERVTLDYFEGNKKAAALYEKVGFKHEGLARNATKKDGKYFDLHLLSILRAEYYAKLHQK